MPRATECVIDVKLAAALRDLLDVLPVKVFNGDIGMRCVECGELVKPHTASETGSAHFEHLNRNAKCSLSDPARS